MAWLTTTKPETTLQEMLNTIRDSLSDLATSDNAENVEDKVDDDDDHELGKLSKDDEPCRGMNTVTKMVLHRMEHFRQHHMKLDESKQPGRRDAAAYFCGRDW